MESPWKEAVIRGPVAYPEPRRTLVLPRRLEDYDDLFSDLAKMAAASSDPEQAQRWLDTMRVYMAGDLYFLARVSSTGQRVDEFTGKMELDNEFLFHFARDVQFDSDDVIDTGGRGMWKALALDTPLPTPSGWTTVGEVRVGDVVFDGYGDPTEVVGLSDIVPCDKRVRFGGKSGASFVTSGDHRWWVEGFCGSGKRGVKSRSSRFETTNGMASKRPAYQFRVRLRPLELPEADLPIHPYVLGLWLGDGDSSGSRITCAEKDAEEILLGIRPSHTKAESAVVRPGIVNIRVGSHWREQGCRSDFVGPLRELGIFGNKGIPTKYLRASASQRLSLLRGLMDTDGTVNADGTAYFSSSSRRLADDAHELVASLGYRVRRGLYHHKGGKPEHRILFCPLRGDDVFWLSRKRERLPESRRHGNRLWCLWSVEETDPVPGRCLAVSSERKTFLAGREMIPTGNSTLKAFLLVLQDTINDPNVMTGFFSFEYQAAKKHCDRCGGEIVANPLYQRVLPEVFGKGLDTDSRFPRPLGSQRWSSRDGYIVPGRTLALTSPTWHAYTFMQKLPTGARLSHMVFDDIETETTSSSPDTIEEALGMFVSATRLRGQGVKLRMNGTFHHETGLLSRIVKIPGWRIRCYPIVDVTKPAPEIPKIHPVTQRPIPKEIQEQDIEGEPLLHHPLEVATIKATHEATNRLHEFYMHYHGDVRRGESRTLDPDWIQWYDERPEELASGGVVYICQDPSPGKYDPTFTWVWLTLPPDRFYWIDGFEEKLAPSERLERTLEMVRKWAYYTVVDHVRIEQYGPATFFEDTVHFFEQSGVFVPVGMVRDYTRTNTFDTGKLDRIWARWEPPARAGRIFFPRQLTRPHPETGKQINLVERFMEGEYKPFPRCERDNGLDAGGMIFIPGDKGKNAQLPRVYHPAAMTKSPDEFEEPGYGQPTWRSA